MSVERPVTRADAQSLVAQIEAAISAGASYAVLQFCEQDMQFERDAAGGFTLTRPGAPASHVFPPAPERPPEYPANLPFIPDELVISTSAGVHESLVWWAPRDVEQLLREIERQSQNAHWTLQAEQNLPEVSHRSYARDDLVRSVISSMGFVMLSQRRT